MLVGSAWRLGGELGHAEPVLTERPNFVFQIQVDAELMRLKKRVTVRRSLRRTGGSDLWKLSCSSGKSMKKFRRLSTPYIPIQLTLDS